MVFRCLQPRKAPGPDGISGKVLQSCSAHLAPVFPQIFNASRTSNSIPSVWKHSLICPVPKKPKPSCPNDYRPIARTPIIMKCLERLVLSRLLSQTSDQLHPLQFAYRHNRGVDDAVITLLLLILTHLETPKSIARVLSVDFSSAFNKLRPHLLADKLLHRNVSPSLILWILNFLVERTQCVRVNNLMSSVVTTSVGNPQECVVSPVLYILFTNDCTSSNDRTHYVKFADDTGVVDLSNSDADYFAEVGQFVLWCHSNHLLLNVGKTEAMVVDFRKPGSGPTSGSPLAFPQPLVIDGTIVTRTDVYKYLGTLIDSRLSFTDNTDLIFKKAQGRLYAVQTNLL